VQRGTQISTTRISRARSSRRLPASTRPRTSSPASSAATSCPSSCRPAKGGRRAALADARRKLERDRATGSTRTPWTWWCRIGEVDASHERHARVDAADHHHLLVVRGAREVRCPHVQRGESERRVSRRRDELRLRVDDPCGVLVVEDMRRKIRHVLAEFRREPHEQPHADPGGGEGHRRRARSRSLPPPRATPEPSTLAPTRGGTLLAEPA
jgi:hypothetical protein